MPTDPKLLPMRSLAQIAAERMSDAIEAIMACAKAGDHEVDEALKAFNLAVAWGIKTLADTYCAQPERQAALERIMVEFIAIYVGHPAAAQWRKDAMTDTTTDPMDSDEFASELEDLVANGKDSSIDKADMIAALKEQIVALEADDDEEEDDGNGEDSDAELSDADGEGTPPAA